MLLNLSRLFPHAVWTSVYRSREACSISGSSLVYKKAAREQSRRLTLTPLLGLGSKPPSSLSRVGMPQVFLQYQTGGFFPPSPPSRFTPHPLLPRSGFFLFSTPPGMLMAHLCKVYCYVSPTPYLSYFVRPLLVLSSPKLWERTDRQTRASRWAWARCVTRGRQAGVLVDIIYDTRKYSHVRCF